MSLNESLFVAACRIVHDDIQGATGYASAVGVADAMFQTHCQTLRVVDEEHWQSQWHPS